MTVYTILWALAQLAIVAYCMARGIKDYREQRPIWAALGFAAAAAILFLPNPAGPITATVTVPIPSPAPSNDLF